MKKYSLTLILVLCLFVITGGTYAAWTYYSEPATAGESTGNGFTMSVQTATKGQIVVTPSALVIEITHSGDYIPAFGGSGNLGVTLTKNPSGPTHADDLSGSLQFKVSVVDSGLGEGLITVKNSNWQDCTATISAKEIYDSLNINHSSALNLKSDYDTFKGKLDCFTITVTVQEKPDEK